MWCGTAAKCDLWRRNGVLYSEWRVNLLLPLTPQPWVGLGLFDNSIPLLSVFNLRPSQQFSFSLGLLLPGPATLTWVSLLVLFYMAYILSLSSSSFILHSHYIGCKFQSFVIYKLYYILLFHPMPQLVICFNSLCSICILF